MLISGVQLPRWLLRSDKQSTGIVTSLDFRVVYKRESLSQHAVETLFAFLPYSIGSVVSHHQDTEVVLAELIYSVAQTLNDREPVFFRIANKIIGPKYILFLDLNLAHLKHADSLPGAVGHSNSI